MKGKKVRWIGLSIASVILLALGGIALFFLVKGDKEPAYTYEAYAEKLPEYDTDLFTIDGKLDEDIYKNLRWWDEIYSEGSEQEPVRVRATTYMGENGVYLVFDVDDDKVYVSETRSSYDNSCISVYLAAEGSHKLTENVWEIDLVPNEFINAKRYIGGYYYGAIKASSWDTQPFVRVTTKEGKINTPECKGYIMESYFPYEFLFKGEGIPENMNLNFALGRSYSLENTTRDVYYSFGQNMLSKWSWSDPGTWWTFNKGGLDSVDIIYDGEKGGSFEHRNNYIARYMTEKVQIIPDNGYRIAGLMMETNGETKDVMDQITWEDGINYIKIRNATDDVKLSATFEKIPSEKATLTGAVTLSGKALSQEELKDIQIRFISGGVAYETTLSEGGTYGFDVPTGSGTLEVFSKNHGYVAKRIALNVTQPGIHTGIRLTANDYGNKRVMSLPTEQVMGNKEIVFNGAKMTGSMANTFSYDFTLKYNGKLLEKDGTPVADPTFGEYDNQYTSVNVNGTFTDAKGKALDNSSMNLQIMSWDGNGMWMVKMWLDSKTVTARLGIDELQAFLSEDGASFRLIFANTKLTLYMVRGNNTFKLTEIEAKNSADRYLSSLALSTDHCINHSIWSIHNQELALSRTQSSYPVIAKVANGDGVAEFEPKKDKRVRKSTNWEASDFNGSFGWTGKLRVPSVLKSGKIQYRKMEAGYWVDTSKDKKTWYQYNIFLIGDGDSYYVAKNSNSERVKLNADQVKLLGTTGLPMGVFAQGKDISYFVDNGKGEMAVFADLNNFNENSAWFPWPNQYGGAYILHEGAKGLGEVISIGAEFYTNLSKDMDVSGFVKKVVGAKYQNNQTLNPVTYSFDLEDKNYFVMNHKDVAEDAFYGYNIKLEELKDVAIHINTKAWNEEYYSNYVKLRITEDCAYFVWQQGVSPYQSSEAIYFLNQVQLAKLTNGGLDIYIEFKDNSPAMNLYADDGKGNIVLASTYNESLFRKSTGVTTVKNLMGYSVEVKEPQTKVTVTATGCVTSEMGDFASNVKSMYNKAIVQGVSNEKLIKIDSRQMAKSTEKINLDYLSVNVGGNWFDRFNVKLADCVDKDGKILKDAAITMSARMQGDQYYGQNLVLYLEKDGMGYIEFTYYGGRWESYYYRLNESQLVQLASKDGMDFFVTHKNDENKITIYFADGETLIPLKVFTYGESELLAKGYSVSNKGDENVSLKIIAECYRHEDSLVNALNQAYGKTYTISDETVPVAKSIDVVTSPKESVNLDYGSDVVGGAWLDHFAVKLDGAVNADGEILKYSTTKLMGRLTGDTYFGQNMYLRLTESGAYLEMANYGTLDGNWSTYVYELSASQLKNLISEDGMDFYLACDGNNKVTVYLEDGANLIAVKEFTYGSKELMAKGYSVSYTGNEADSIYVLAECIPYEGTFETVVKDFYSQSVAGNVFDSIYNYNSVVKADKFGAEITEAGQKLENYTHVWDNYFYKVNIKNAGVDEDGNVTKASKITIRHDGEDSKGYKGHMSIELNLKEEGSTMKFSQVVAPWTTKTISLPSKALKALGSDKGLNIYILHDGTVADTFVVYMQDGGRLLEMFSCKVKDANHGRLCQVTYNEGTEKVTVSGEAYNYVDTDFVTAVETIYGKNFDVAKEVNVNVTADGAVVKGMKNSYHVGDKVSFTVQVNEGYELETVALNGTTLTADKDGKYQFELTEDHLTACNVTVTAKDKKALLTFKTYTGLSTTGNFGNELFDDKKLNSIMGTEGYAYLFHTTFKSNAATLNAYTDTTNAYMQVSYLGWGSAAEQYYVGLYKTSTGWSLKLHQSTKYWPSDFVAEYALSSAQVAEITVNGLDIGLVNSNGTTYTLYVEQEGVMDMAASLVSPKSNKQVYEVKHASVDTAAVMTTTGAFYGDVYTRATAAQAVLDEQDSSTIGKTHQQIKKLTGSNTNTNFGNELFDGKKVNSIMGTSGYDYLFHTIFKSTATTLNAYTDTTNAYMQLGYLGWGTAAEQYYVGLYKTSTGWSLKLHQSTKYWPSDFVAEYKLSGAQVAEITGDGLDIFLVNSNGTTFTLYVEQEGVVDMAVTLVSPKNNKQIYEVKHASVDTAAVMTTTGYFYGSGYNRATAAQNMLK